jgi:hypothetical protein
MAITPSMLPSEEDFARIEAKLFGRLERSHTRQVRRHRFVAAAAVVAVAGAGLAAAAITDGLTAQHVAYCYSSASTAGTPVTVQAPDAAPTSDGGSASAVPVALANCAAAWQSGALSPSSTPSSPTLQACVRNDQLIAVFPRTSAESLDAFCTGLGLTAP